MAVRKELIDLKFHIYDETDICHDTYEPSTTILTLIERLVAKWPEVTHFFIFSGKEVTPKSINDVKLIHGGQFLDNRKTPYESRVVFDGNVITMHVVVQPNGPKNTKRNKSEKEKMNSCSCTII
ncbi:hypothetical protein UlMin_005423 [Ulmus minor]